MNDARRERRVVAVAVAAATAMCGISVSLLTPGTATDAASRTQLGEVKTIHHCRSRYSDGDVDTGVFGAAVQRRAGTLAAEYERGARKLDTEYGTTPPGADGPCLQRLRGFGDIAAFVLGASGEVSKDFERWVACVAATRAAAMRRIMGARTDVQARGCIAWRVRRRVGWAAFIAAAQLKTAVRELRHQLDVARLEQKRFEQRAAAGQQPASSDLDDPPLGPRPPMSAAARAIAGRRRP